MQFIIRPNPLEPFKPLYRLPKGTWLVINVGPRGSGKSYEAAKYATIRIISEKIRVALLRDEQVTISDSILHEVKSRFNEIDEKAGGHYSRYWDVQEHVIKNKETGFKHLFSKGFRTSKTTQRAGLKSIADIDLAIVEEFEDIQDEEKFNTFADSIRKEGAIILINSNIPSKNHWFVKRYYNLEQQEGEFSAYYKLLPKDIPGVVYLTSTYKDNPHLPPSTVARYEGYGDPNSYLYNVDHYATDILGLVSEGARGRIYPGWKPITLELFRSLPYASFYGLDFGYSNDPVALIEMKAHNNRLFWHEQIYKTEMSDDDLAAEMVAKGISKTAPIYADPAEPKSIAALRKKGFNVQEAEKGPDSVDYGIKFVKARQNFYTDCSEDLINENQEYRWRLKDGEPTNEPEDKNNHLKDAGRYAATTHKGERKINATGPSNTPGVVQPGTKKKNKLDYLRK